MKPYAALAPLLLTTASPALAWGNEGHRIVALIAQTYMTPTALTAARNLLAADSDDLTAKDFASRATWADAYRDTDKKTAPWHFVNLELAGPDVTRACRHSCAPAKIDQFATELRNSATKPNERLLAFEMLLHLVGDIHQPLHASDNHDGGANCEQVSYGGYFGGYFATTVSLHHYWDSDVVESFGTDPSRIAATWRKTITKEQLAGWSRGTPYQWAMESYDVARNVAYRFGGVATCDTTTPVTLSAPYQAAARQAAQVQLEKAGVRLAGILNAALAHQPDF